MSDPPAVRRTRSGSFASGPADAPVRLTRSTSPLLQTMVPIQAPTQALPQAPVPAAAAAAHQSPAPHPNELAIFWDYENVSLGVKFSETLLEGLLNHVRQYGRLIEARLYSDSAKLTMSGVSRAMLDRRGVTFIDCPTGNKKEAVDKKIIVDALVWALPRASTQRPCTVVLISGDGDFAHMLSRMRLSGVYTVVLGTRVNPALASVSDAAIAIASLGPPTAVNGPDKGRSRGSISGREASVPSKRGKKRARDDSGESSGTTADPGAAAVASSATCITSPSALTSELKYGERVQFRFIACDRVMSVEQGGVVRASHSVEWRRPESCLSFICRNSKQPGSRVCYGDELAVGMSAKHATRHLDVEPLKHGDECSGAVVRARWQDPLGEWQRLKVEGGPHGEALKDGDTIFLRAMAVPSGRAGGHADTSCPHLMADPNDANADRPVIAAWADHGAWQAIEVKKRLDPKSPKRKSPKGKRPRKAS